MDPSAPVPPYVNPPFQTPPPASNRSGGGIAGVIGAVVGRGMRRILGIVVILAVIAGGAFIYYKVANPDHRGQVIFTTTDQQGNSGCDISNRVSTAKSGTSIYVFVMWSRTMSSADKVVEEDLKDGVSLGTTAWDTTDYAGYDCTSDSTDYSQSFSDPGAYEIKLTVGTDVVADGTLTVTQ